MGFIAQEKTLRLWPTLLSLTLVSIISLLFIYSSTHTVEQPYSIFFKKQLFGFISGLFIFLFFALKDYRSLCRWGYFFFYFTLVLLVFTIIKGSIGMGAQRWINLGFFKFQPSELMKLFLPPFITYYLFTEEEAGQYKFSSFWTILGFLAFSFLLILKQPDLGTAIIIGSSGAIMLWYAGIGRRFFIISMVSFIISAPILYSCLKPYQRKRIEVFLGAGDTKNERYQIEQSKIAIGSGGLTGKGFLQGTQTQLSFLPESRTDFILAVLCEEWGFIGAILLILLYAFLIVRLMVGISYINSFFSQLLCIGLLSPIMLSTIINIGMVSGMLPIVGIPLPLMSYGLTHTWITLACIGWIIGASYQHPDSRSF